MMLHSSSCVNTTHPGEGKPAGVPHRPLLQTTTAPIAPDYRRQAPDEGDEGDEGNEGDGPLLTGKGGGEQIVAAHTKEQNAFRL